MIEIDNHLKELIENNIIGIATITPENKPHIIPVAFVKVVSKNQIIITDNFMIETVQNIKKNKAVALVFWTTNMADIDNCKGYELRGKAQYFNSGEWAEFVKSMEENKGLAAKGAILVTVEKIKRAAG